MDQELKDFLDRVGVRGLCPSAVDEIKQHVGENADVWEKMTNPAWMLRYARKIGVQKKDIRRVLNEINLTDKQEKIDKYDCDLIRKILPAPAMHAARIKKTAELDAQDAQIIKEIEK